MGGGPGLVRDPGDPRFFFVSIPRNPSTSGTWGMNVLKTRPLMISAKSKDKFGFSVNRAGFGGNTIDVIIEIPPRRTIGDCEQHVGFGASA